ncbi:selenium metabolism-associated LysR family transcriptional regulator [Acetohalobium arabaticum]|uniref:Transcriptional regulator, LysR family n=1 Tax=Acetohalobium arabaticum (strain ATCC 49924 / DSM 5501 / Z-7288) TaxID=574087 RepID=D9QQQ1_ACEAZ|nr:selenium metabolism-associated LysR family transcriptional regulator [Acetohalobium arabaticum]ADL12842.1 transcriptional regulator, LysR family [Acetohalobium arabaticum DSM 5501]
MKLKTLKMLVKLIEMGSFSAVADKLDLTQPAVSMQIKSLEKRFDTDLVVRQDGGIKLTPTGKIIYRKAKRILDVWEEAKLEIEQVKGETFDQLIIGASTIPSEYLLPDLLAEFYKKFPQVEVLMEVGDSTEIINNLEDREVDIIIVGSKPTQNQFEVVSVIEDRLVLILPLEHRLINSSHVSLADLIKEQILIREQGSGTRKAMLAGLKEAGIDKAELNLGLQLGSTEAVISAVEAGLGVSFVSELAASKAVDNRRVEKVKVNDMLISRKLYLAYHQERKNEALIKEFRKIF